MKEKIKETDDANLRKGAGYAAMLSSSGGRFLKEYLEKEYDNASQKRLVLQAGCEEDLRCKGNMFFINKLLNEMNTSINESRSIREKFKRINTI